MLTAAQARSMAIPKWKKRLEDVLADIEAMAKKEGLSITYYGCYWDSNIERQLASLGYKMEFGRGVPNMPFQDDNDEVDFVKINW